MEKLSFYDLVSFLLPGIILLWGVMTIWPFDLTGNIPFPANNEFSVSLILLFFGYLAGMTIHELSECTETECKSGNKLFWRYRWITEVYQKKLKREKRNIIAVELKKQHVNPKSREFQVEYFNKISMHQDTRTLHAQSVLCRNSFTVFTLLTLSRFIHDICICFPLSAALIHAAPFAAGALIMWWLTVRRKKAIIRTVFWNHAKELGKK